MPRTIKRYDNRKLYDTEASAYVSLRDVAGLVRHGETVEVIDNTTGDDLTAQTLTQVILEEGKRGDHLLPTDLLHDLLRRSGEAVGSGIAGLDQLRHGATDLVQHSLGRLTRLVRSPARSDDLAELRRQLEQLEEQLAKVLDENDQASK